jgi:two-component system C4-dicarboxylate transport sensor histidine kinase DctB
MAWADPRALEQVLLGVVTNAMEAVSGVEGPLVTIEVREEPGTVVIRVLDNGPGVRLEDLPHVFLPLFTTKPRGTGLGLPIARTMLSKMEGTIELANRRDGGASVEITLSAGMREPRLTLP